MKEIPLPQNVWIGDQETRVAIQEDVTRWEAGAHLPVCCTHPASTWSRQAIGVLGAGGSWLRCRAPPAPEMGTRGHCQPPCLPALPERFFRALVVAKQIVSLVVGEVAVPRGPEVQCCDR